MGREMEVGGKIIPNFSFGLPPFGRVPGFGMGIADLKARSRSDGFRLGGVHPTTMMITKYLSDQPRRGGNDPTYGSDN